VKTGGRPKNKHPTTEVRMKATPKLLAYFEALIDEEGFGETRPEVAENLCWRMIEELIRAGTLARIRGALTEEGPDL
jgi:hypothetical protein